MSLEKKSDIKSKYESLRDGIANIKRNAIINHDVERLCKSHFMFHRNVHAFIVPDSRSKSSVVEGQSSENIVSADYVDMWLNNAGEAEYLGFVENGNDQSQTKKDGYVRTRKMHEGNK